MIAAATGGVVGFRASDFGVAVGGLAVQAIANRDYPVVQAAVFLLAAIFVLINFLVDVLYSYVDPRVAYK